MVCRMHSRGSTCPSRSLSIRVSPAGRSAADRVELRAMAAADATTVEAAGRAVRVSSADRVIFPETDHSAAVTKLDIVNYYVSVGDGIMRALGRRPTTLE